MSKGTEIGQRLAAKHSGLWSPADQGAILALALQHGMKEADRGGVCWEVCRRWIKARLFDEWRADETIYAILSPTKGTATTLDEAKLLELIQAHAARNIAGVAGNYVVAGLQNHVTQYRTYGCLGASGLKSRDAVLDIIFKLKGAYIFSFSRAAGGGHAIAFDTTSAPYAFMDPNSGDGTFALEAKFRSFFKEYYGEAYKAEYSKGDRELTRYTRGARAAF